MIVVRIMGGLGNQMFQYAFGRRLAFKHNTELKLDLSFYFEKEPKKGRHVKREYDLDIFNVVEKFATDEEVFRLSKRVSYQLLDRSLSKVFGPKKSYVIEPHYHFSEAVYNSPDDVYLAGYWQTEQYFSEINEIIRADFTFKEAMDEKAEELLDEINNTPSICVNVRRGDFVTNDFHGAYGVEYFKRAERIIEHKMVERKYFVFSDEIDWCQENLRFGAPTFFVSHEFAGRKFQNYLRLMAACKHFIIPNSSFAWWAVWFNRDLNKIVIAPKVWFNDLSLDTSDLTPNSWIRI